jgi:hypothetical protein
MRCYALLCVRFVFSSRWLCALSLSALRSHSIRLAFALRFYAFALRSPCPAFRWLRVRFALRCYAFASYLTPHSSLLTPHSPHLLRYFHRIMSGLPPKTQKTQNSPHFIFLLDKWRPGTLIDHECIRRIDSYDSISKFLLAGVIEGANYINYTYPCSCGTQPATMLTGTFIPATPHPPELDPNSRVSKFWKNKESLAPSRMFPLFCGACATLQLK